MTLGQVLGVILGLLTCITVNILAPQFFFASIALGILVGIIVIGVVDNDPDW